MAGILLTGSPEGDRTALVVLYEGTDGDNWHHSWDVAGNISTWYGVTVNGEGRVVKLLLDVNNLRGSIPPELGDLGELQELRLEGNQLSGSIPPELGDLGELQELRLEGNQLSGVIPSELGNLGDLLHLDLSNNQLSGSIPPELGDLGELQELRLNDNQLSGTIPAALGQLGKLERLDLSFNKLEGSIPPELGDLGELKELWLQGNQLSGSIPRELGNLTAVKFLHLFNNKLSGIIPPELANLGALQLLNLSSNNLSGRIPRELGDLSALVQLHLFSNNLSGCIPPDLRKLRALKVLLVNKNQLSGLWDHTQPVVGPRCWRDGVIIPNELDGLLAWLLENRIHLVVHGNPWSEPPAAVMQKGMEEVSNYFVDLYKETPVKVNSIKVVLVGQEGAGKTSLRQSMKTREPHCTCGPQDSTVQIDVDDMTLDGVSVRLYDCAGQVAYAGLLQMFLTQRALTLLVCDISAFGQKDGGLDDAAQLDEDIRKLDKLRVCDWLRSLSLRVPDNDVILVATKCDRAAGMVADTAARIESASREWLRRWAPAGMTVVCIEDGVSLTSCSPGAVYRAEDSGSRKEPKLEQTWPCDWRDAMHKTSPSLLHRVVNYPSGRGRRAATMILPRSWHIALTVLEALAAGRDPVQSAQRAWNDKGGGAVGEVDATVEAYKGIKTDELNDKWSSVVRELETDGLDIANANQALEGALSIREFEGSLVRHETYAFLDVTLLQTLLKPLLNHKDTKKFDGSISLGDMGSNRITLTDSEHIESWITLKEHGVLEPKLARVLWPDLSDYVLPTLASLGLTFPLEGGPAQGWVVLLILPLECPETVAEDLDAFRSDHTEVLKVRWEVNLGVPPGAVEKVLTRCCSIGAIQTFWRFGALVQGDVKGGNFGGKFALLVEFVPDKNEVEMRIYGNLSTAGPWAALSYGISAMRTMASEFPGLRSQGYLECPQHRKDMRVTNKETRPGDMLLCEKPCRRCSPETGGLGAAAGELLQMVDIRQSRDEVFTGLNDRLVGLQKRYKDLHPEGYKSRMPASVKEIKTLVGGAPGDGAEGAGGDGGSAGAAEGLQALGKLLGHGLDALEQKQQDVLGELGNMKEHFQNNFQKLEDLLVGADGVMGNLELAVNILMALRGDGIDTPRMACVLPPWDFKLKHGLSDDEQTPESWTGKLNNWREGDFKEGKGYFKTKIRLFLVCAHTYRLVPCGHDGQGYDIQRHRKWLRKTVCVMTIVLQVACAMLGAMAVAQLASAIGTAADETVSAAINGVVPALEARLARMMVDDPDYADVAQHQDAVQHVEVVKGNAYQSLRKFVHEMEDVARLTIIQEGKKAHKAGRAPTTPSFVFFDSVMAKVQARKEDATVHWVLKGQEKRLENSTGSGS